MSGGSPHGPATATVTVAVACLGFFVVVLDTTIVNVALPSIARDLGGGVRGQQWVVDGYTLLFGALVLSAGALSDRIGAKDAFGWGLVLFAAGSVACGLAPTLGWLVAARICQGAAAALMLPSSLALAGQAHSDPRARARAISMWSAAGGAAVAAGPIAGGLLTQGIGWRAVFFVNVPLAAAGVVALRRVPASAVRRARVDVAGQGTAAVALAALTVALIEGGRRGFDDGLIVAAFAVALVASVLFVVAELRAPEPAVPMRLLWRRESVGTIVAGASLYFSFYGVIFTLSLFFQDVLGDGPAVTGLMFVPMTALLTVATMTVSRWRHRFPAWVPLGVGLSLMLVGLLGLSLADAGTSRWLVALCTVPFGIGSAVAGPGIFVAMLASMPEDRAGIASGVANANRQVAATLGVAIFGTLLAREADLVPGMQRAYLVSAGAIVLGLLFTLLCVRPRAMKVRHVH